ncbi:MAG: nickel-dependent lactate racemase [Synergistaceae bacterium]|jgi:nickel-dependent lactate racemase|nr:nickel-dependent lactate racemase [Synergistaceae bacterium]
MDTLLKYGRKEIVFSIPDRNLLGVLEPSSALPPVENLGQAVRAVLGTPTAGPSLEERVKERKPRSVAVIVNDMTRSTPSDQVLPPLLEELKRLGVPREAVTVVVATGTHRAMTEPEIDQLLGKEITSAYKVENHLCDAPDLVDMGTLSTGNKLLVNSTVARADLRIAVGEVLLHYYAGFAGGRKSILPGVAGRKTIMRNHEMMTDPGVGIGLLEGNRLYAETDEAVERFCPLHFIVNLVSDSHKRVVRVVGGHFHDAWLEGVKTFREMNFVTIPGPADAVIASAGGYPKDINMYQAHKAIYMASYAVKKRRLPNSADWSEPQAQPAARDRGVLLFFAELEEGYGHKMFAQWAESGRTPAEVSRDFEAEFHFGAHKLYYLAQHALDFDTYLHSQMDEEKTRRMFCRKFEPKESLDILKGRLGPDFTAWIIPQGGIVLPQVKG